MIKTKKYVPKFKKGNHVKSKTSDMTGVILELNKWRYLVSWISPEFSGEPPGAYSFRTIDTKFILLIDANSIWQDILNEK
jgi:hypothetical protein